MYDRLGELLSETLEAGRVKFVRVQKQEKPAKEEPLSREAQKFFTKDSAESSSEEARRANEAVEKNARIAAQKKEKARAEREKDSRAAFGSYAGMGGATGTVYKDYEYRRISPQAEQAFKILGLPATAGVEQVKSAYREKLKLYHPDHNTASETLQKVAASKTDELVKAYGLLMELLK